MLFLCYPKCSTCQKAKKWLDDHQIEYQQRHIVTDNPTVEELQDWYQKSGLPLKKFFNTSGLLYKQMDLKQELTQLNPQQQLELLAGNGMLVKRPIVVKDDIVLVGFQETLWDEKLR